VVCYRRHRIFRIGSFCIILIRGGTPATFILLGIVAFYLVASHLGFNKRSRLARERDERIRKFTAADVDIFKSNRLMMEEHTSQVFQRYDEVLQGLLDYDEQRIEAAYRALREQEEFGRQLRAESVRNIRSLEAGNGRSGELLLYSTDLLQDMMYSAVSLAEESLHYVQNLHLPPNGQFRHGRVITDQDAVVCSDDEPFAQKRRFCRHRIPETGAG
jgi:hypothetical protein